MYQVADSKYQMEATVETRHPDWVLWTAMQVEPEIDAFRIAGTDMELTQAVEEARNDPEASYALLSLSEEDIADPAFWKGLQMNRELRMRQAGRVPRMRSVA